MAKETGKIEPALIGGHRKYLREVSTVDFGSMKPMQCVCSSVNHNWKGLRFNKISVSHLLILPQVQTTDGADFSVVH